MDGAVMSAGCNAELTLNGCTYRCDGEVLGHDSQHWNEELGASWHSGHTRQPTHGKRATYLSGCRCEPCRKAARPSRRRQDYVKRQRTADAPAKSQQWTGPELEIAARSDLTSVEVALMLGRTYSGVKNIRAKLLRDPRKQNLAGVKAKKQ